MSSREKVEAQDGRQQGPGPMLAIGLSLLQDRGSELWIKDLNLGRKMRIGLIHTYCIHVSTEVLKVIYGIGGS